MAQIITAEQAAGLSDRELEEAMLILSTEYDARQAKNAIPEQVEKLAAQYSREVLKRQDGEEWREPAGAVEGYAAGAVVTHRGKRWRSKVGANVWEPGNATSDTADRFWELIPNADGTTGPVATVPRWSANSHTYKRGDRVSYGGLTYEVIEDHTSQAAKRPDAASDLYKRIS